MQIVRGDVSGFVAWVEETIAKLDRTRPLPFRYVSKGSCKQCYGTGFLNHNEPALGKCERCKGWKRLPEDEKVQEVLCAWDEVSTQELGSFVLKDKETKKAILDKDGNVQIIRYVTLSKRQLTHFEQAKKLLGILPSGLMAWRNERGREVLVRLLEKTRPPRQVEEPKEQPTKRFAKKTANSNPKGWTSVNELPVLKPQTPEEAVSQSWKLRKYMAEILGS